MIDELPDSGKRAVIIQPSYLPWRGFFHLLYLADVCIFLDDVQYDKDSWRNRNRIKGANGSFWLTVPVKLGGWPPPPILDVEIDRSRDWSRKHRKAIRLAYSGRGLHNKHLARIESLLDHAPTKLADLDISTTVGLAKLLGFELNAHRASELGVSGAPAKPTSRLVQICRAVGATHYLSGPSARSYIEAERFEEANIRLEFMEYEYPRYPQRFGEFDPQLSVVDLLLNCGDEAPDFIWGRRAREHRQRLAVSVSDT